ncbi:MAG: cell division protein ZapA [Candidatus Cloacimonetes bacterium]|nr:cell division protein ZapA [Candidatus Cloacimonadota bacterium]
MQSVEVEIFGRRFRLRSDDPTRTKKIAADLSQQLHDIYEANDQLDFARLLLLVCFKQQEDYQLLLEDNDKIRAELERMNQMIEKIVSV